MKRILTLFLVLACAWIASGGPLDSGLPVGSSKSSTGVNLPLDTVITADSLVIDGVYLTDITKSSPSSGQFSYVSDDDGVASVSYDGVVKLISTGSCNITISQAAVPGYFSEGQTQISVSCDFDPWTAPTSALYCDGSDDVASASAAGLPSGNNPRTMMVWVYDLASSSTSYHQFCGYGNASTRQAFSLCFYASSSQAVTATWFNFDPMYVITREESWQHYAFVYPDLASSGATACTFNQRVYKNGSLMSNPAITAVFGETVTTGKSVYLGANPGYSAAKCKLAEFAVFDRALSDDEIAFYYDKKLSPQIPGIVRLYHCDEGGGTTLVDACGSGYDAALLNGATWTTRL